MKPSDASSLSTIIEVVGLLGAWLLVVLGWMIVSDQEERRGLIRTAHEDFKVLRHSLKHVAELAVAHHTTKFDATKHRALVRSIGAIATELAHLRKCGFVGAEVTALIIAVRKAATYRNDSASNYQAVSVVSTEVEEIDSAIDALDRFLMHSSQAVISEKRTLLESLKIAWHRII